MRDGLRSVLKRRADIIVVGDADELASTLGKLRSTRVPPLKNGNLTIRRLRPRTVARTPGRSDRSRFLFTERALDGQLADLTSAAPDEVWQVEVGEPVSHCRPSAMEQDPLVGFGEI